MDKTMLSSIKISIIATAGFLFGEGLLKEVVLFIPLFLGFVLLIWGLVLEDKSLNPSEQEIKDKTDLILLRNGKLNELGVKH